MLPRRPRYRCQHGARSCRAASLGRRKKSPPVIAPKPARNGQSRPVNFWTISLFMVAKSPATRYPSLERGGLASSRVCSSSVASLRGQTEGSVNILRGVEVVSRQKLFNSVLRLTERAVVATQEVAILSPSLGEMASRRGGSGHDSLSTTFARGYLMNTKPNFTLGSPMRFLVLLTCLVFALTLATNV